MMIALYVGWGLFAASVGYLLVASFCVLKFRRNLGRTPAAPKDQPGVTLYKPLHGLDCGLMQNLASFCRQDYPDYQIVFGVSDANDPAISVVHEIMAEFPKIDMELVISGRSNGNNPKVNNLINMDALAKHDVLIISDSDMRVEADYIRRVIGGFESERVGLVTCLYKGTPVPGLASHLGAMFINQWFTPSALIPATFGQMKHCFGATMAIRRDVLLQIGGLDALVGNLADDYTLGRLVREAGYDIRLGDAIIENIVEEADVRSLVLHELRWARTIRSVEPLGFVSTFLTDTIPLGIIVGLMAYLTGYGLFWVLMPIIMALCARIILHFSTKVTFISKQSVPFWMIPVRDVLSFVVRLLCYTGRTVNWRDSNLSVGKAGELSHLKSRSTADKRYEKDPVPESTLL